MVTQPSAASGNARSLSKGQDIDSGDTISTVEMECKYSSYVAEIPGADG